MDFGFRSRSEEAEMRKGGVVEWEDEWGCDVAGLLARDRRSLNILSVKKESKLWTS